MNANAFIAVILCFGVAGGVIGKIKGSSFWIWFFVSGMLPGIGIFAAVLYRFDRDEPRRACPNCGSICMGYDALCTVCGQELTFPQASQQEQT